jgi:hypothetical protein
MFDSLLDSIDEGLPFVVLGVAGVLALLAALGVIGPYWSL